MAGLYCTLSSNSRVSSTFVRDAASISSRSTKLPSSIDWQFSHFPQGSEVTPLIQFKLFAKIRAIVVLPTPRVPLNK